MVSLQGWLGCECSLWLDVVTHNCLFSVLCKAMTVPVKVWFEVAAGFDPDFRKLKAGAYLELSLPPPTTLWEGHACLVLASA